MIHSSNDICRVKPTLRPRKYVPWIDVFHTILEVSIFPIPAVHVTFGCDNHVINVTRDKLFGLVYIGQSSMKEDTTVDRKTERYRK